MQDIKDDERKKLIVKNSLKKNIFWKNYFWFR